MDSGSPKNPLADENPPAPWSSRAIVVVHGIGVQAPRATLQAFTHGLAKLGAATLVEKEIGEPAPFGQKIPPAPDRIRLGSKDADVYEIYWAPRASRKTTARSVLGWILRLTFIPGSKVRPGRFKNLFDASFMLVGVGAAAFLLLWTLVALGNLTDFAKCVQTGQELTEEELARCRLAFAELDPQISLEGFEQQADVAGPAPGPALKRLGDVGGVLWRVLRRVPGELGEGTLQQLSVSNGFDVVKAIPLEQVLWLALLIWVAAQVLYRLAQVGVTGSLGRRLKATIGLLLQLGGLALALQYLPAPSLSVAVAVLAAVLLYRLFLARRPPAAKDRNRFVTKIVSSINAGFVLLGVAVLAALAQLTEPVYAAFGLLLAFAWLIVRGTNGFLTESIGDVQVYTTRNPNNPNFAVRGEILADAEAVFHAISNRKYESIVVVGHSLGAVVALEAVQGLRHRIPDLLGHIKGFVTVGAAVEKVKYFFGQDSSAETRGLEAAVEDTIQGPTTAERGLTRAVGLAAGKPWLNLWYWNDVVADPIFSFGSPEDQPRYGWRDVKGRVLEAVKKSDQKRVVNVRFGTAAVWSHSKYWGDRRTLDVIAQAANHWT